MKVIPIDIKYNRRSHVKNKIEIWVKHRIQTTYKYAFLTLDTFIFSIIFKFISVNEASGE